MKASAAGEGPASEQCLEALFPLSNRLLDHLKALRKRP
jgi:hypothetical protein